jgi:multiple sugar transport system substrate-binding protein
MHLGSRAMWRKVGAVALVLVLAGQTGGIVSASHSAAGGVVLNLWNDKSTWKAWYDKSGQDALKAIGIGWKSVPYADTTTYQAAVRTAGRTSRAPDLFTWWSGYQMTDIVNAGVAADVSALWDKYKSYYSAGLRSAFTFNGKTYGIPESPAYWEVIYNKHVFAKYHLTPPTTWAQFMTIVNTLRKNGVTPLAATVADTWEGFIYFEEFLVKTNPQAYLNLMAGKIKYTDPVVVKAMKMWESMIKAGDFTDPAAINLGTGAGQNFPGPFSQGKIGMVEIGTWYEPTLIAAGLKPGVDFGTFIWPDINPSAGKVVIFEAGPIVVSAHGQHEADAMKAADYYMSKAGQQDWVNLTGFLPARSDVKAASALDRQMLANISSGYKLIPRYWEATPFQIVQIAVNQFVKFMLHPGDPMPFLQAIQTQADRTWASMK